MSANKYSPVGSGYARIKKSGNLFTVTVTKTERLTTTDDLVCVHKRCKHVDIEPGLQTEERDGAMWTTKPVVTYQRYDTKTVSIVEHLPAGIAGLNRLI